MITRNRRKLVRPGQWVLAKIDPHCWVKNHSYDFQNRDTAWICITSAYEPAWDSKSRFEYTYRVNWRFVNGCDYEEAETKYYSHESEYSAMSTNPDAYTKDGTLCKAACYEFGLLECNGSGQPGPYDKHEHDMRRGGHAGYLYEPASDDPKNCPGGDYSLYFCDKCNRFVTPFSNDDGDLICQWCDAVGIVVTHDEGLDYLESVREKARELGISEKLESKLHQLWDMTFTWATNDAGFDGAKKQTRRLVLNEDFAPMSFRWVLSRHTVPASKDSVFIMNGGLIFHSPSCPGDGSFPSLTVDLGDHQNESYWGIHT